VVTPPWVAANHESLVTSRQQAAANNLCFLEI
jgi:hypothetical protein